MIAKKKNKKIHLCLFRSHYHHSNYYSCIIVSEMANLYHISKYCNCDVWILAAHVRFTVEEKQEWGDQSHMFFYNWAKTFCSEVIFCHPRVFHFFMVKLKASCISQPLCLRLIIHRSFTGMWKYLHETCIYLVTVSDKCILPSIGICMFHWGRSSPCDPLWISPQRGGAWRTHTCAGDMTLKYTLIRTLDTVRGTQMIPTWLWHSFQGSGEYPSQHADRMDFWLPVGT